MKKYRIKNHYSHGYIVQERILLFWWYTHMSNSIHRTDKVFATVEDAKDYVVELKRSITKIKKAKYTEYM